MKKEELIIKLRNYNFSKKIIKAFRDVNREDFVPEKIKDMAYEDIALPLCNGSTISQPYTIAFMLELLELKKKQKILEIGSGSGYVLALISKITGSESKIFGVEIIKELCEKSKKILKENNIEIFCKNGKNGLPERSPFERILISASSEKEPLHLIDQLSEKGIIVAPVKNSILKIKKENSRLKKESFFGFAFVPLKK